MNTLIPIFLFVSCLDFNSARTSIGSSPAFSANVLGIISIESANDNAANCSLPDNVFAYFLNSLASSISMAPAPGTILLYLIEAAKTPKESFTALSISSTTCEVPPLINNVTAFADLHPLTYVISSSPTFFASTIPALPNSFSVRSFILFTITAFVAFANFSMSDFFTLLTA